MINQISALIGMVFTLCSLLCFLCGFYFKTLEQLKSIIKEIKESKENDKENDKEIKKDIKEIKQTSVDTQIHLARIDEFLSHLNSSKKGA